MAATYAKLRSGEWGIKSTVPLRAGDTAVVVKRTGQARCCIVGRVLWTGEDGTCLATIAMSVANKSTPRAARRAPAPPASAIEVTDANEREPEYQAANDDGRFVDEWAGVDEVGS